LLLKEAFRCPRTRPVTSDSAVAQGVPERDTFFARNFLQQAIELRRLEQLLLPKNLFAEPASIDDLMAEATQTSEQVGENVDDVRPCGCVGDRKRDVAQRARNHYGRGVDVLYFWSDACMGEWNRERMQRPANAF
jgi:hypothetical protein